MTHALSRRLGALAALALAALVGACGGDGRTPLVVYSPHGPDLLQAFETRFEAANPGVDVQWVDMGSQEVLDRLRSEKANPQADVWFGAPTPLFRQAADAGLLAPSSPAWGAQLREHSDPQGRYWGVYLTPEVIAYNSQAVDSADAPRDWDDVLDPRWRGQVLIRDPLASGTMRTIFGMVMERSLRATGDTAAGWQWLRRLDAADARVRAQPHPPLPEAGAPGGAGHPLGHARHRAAQGQDGLPHRLHLPRQRDAPGARRHRRRAGRAPPRARPAASWTSSAASAALLLAARDFYRLPARADLPTDSLPPVLRRARAELTPEPMDWQLLQTRGPEWMRYWDEHVRGGG